MSSSSSDVIAQRALALAAAERKASEQFKTSVKGATARLEKRRKQLDQQRKRLERWSDDPVVFVRSFYAGPRPDVYHSSTTCGWCPPDADSLLLGEAEAKRLRPCSSRYCQAVQREPDAA